MKRKRVRRYAKLHTPFERGAAAMQDRMAGHVLSIEDHMENFGVSRATAKRDRAILTRLMND